MSARREHPLFLFDNRTVEKAQVPLVHPLHIRYSLLSNYVYDIGQADDGRLWVCTQMGGVSILDPQALSSGDVRFDNIGAGQRDGISSANARCFFQDSFGNIWIGNYRQGIDFLSYERPIFRTLLPTGSSTDASGANQVWNLANVHAPTVMRAADGYYNMYQTDASWGNVHAGHGHFHARRSKDLVNWEYLGGTMAGLPEWVASKLNEIRKAMGLPAMEVGEDDFGYWAPVVRKVNDNLYRMYYSLVCLKHIDGDGTWGERAFIGLMETTDPASNVWEDKGFIRAKSITGPYYNILGEDVTRGGDALPVVPHPYKFTGSDGWVGISHCAIFTDGDDHWFYASQGRLPKEVNNANMLGHIRSIRWTADGWPLVMPERYGAVPQAPITEAEIAGTWEHIDLSYKYGVQKESQPMEFRADHTIGSGPWQGAKWSFDASRQVIQVDNGTDLYLCRETDWEAKPRTHTLIYAAYSNTGKTYWGKKSK